jgi:hypothetical protein
MRAAERGSKRSGVRLAKGLTIALPVVGGFFAIYLCRQDIERFHEERCNTKTAGAPAVLFAGAIVADFIDVIIHFFITFGLLRHLKRHRLAVAEEISMGCAVVSTICAVVGEILSFHIRNKNKNQTT